LTDNLPRVLPEGLGARITRSSWQVPAEFAYMERVGGVERDEMFRTFNMGIGMVAIVAPDEAGKFEAHLEGAGESHWRIGEVVAGDGRVIYE
jgi:phosphoribosylformylglycinamidine cyclo-ligase